MQTIILRITKQTERNIEVSIHFPEELRTEAKGLTQKLGQEFANDCEMRVEAFETIGEFKPC